LSTSCFGKDNAGNIWGKAHRFRKFPVESVRAGHLGNLSSNSEKGTCLPVRAVFPNGLPDLTGASQAPGFGQGAIRKKQIRKFLCPYKARAHPAEIRVSVTNRDPVTAIPAKDLAKNG